MEQIYQWFEYRKKTCWSFSLYLIRLSLQTIGWIEQEPETELYQAPQTFNCPFSSLLQPFLVWAKTSSFNILNFS